LVMCLEFLFTRQHIWRQIKRSSLQSTRFID